MANQVNADRRLEFFSDLLATFSETCYFWHYDAEGSLMETNCADLALDKVFRRAESYDFMLDYAKENHAPLIMSSAYGLVWGASFEAEEGKLRRIHVMGPIFTQTPDNALLDEMLRSSLITAGWRPKFQRILQRIPVFNMTTFFNLIIAMEYCVSGKRLKHSDLMLQRTPAQQKKKNKSGWQEEERRADRNQVYRAEQAILQMIREGNLNYMDSWQQVANTFTGNQQLSQNHLQHAKLSQVQFIAMCSRAAIEGGLSPEIAYTRNDAYIQDVDNARTVSDITQIGRSMCVDFVELVHKQKADPGISKPIRSCCDYIQTHLGEKISASTLANRVGYADYYLSRLFKQQMGMSIDQYLRNMRIERAKFLMTTTQDSIQEISDQLGFSNRNYFTQVFTQVTGVSPALYRKENQHI